MRGRNDHSTRAQESDWDRIAAGWGVYEDSGMRELGFWVGKPFDEKPATVGNGSMVAFRDPDGNKIAAVCRGYPATERMTAMPYFGTLLSS